MLAYFAEAVRTNNIALLGQAEEALKKAVELKPNYTDAYFLLAQIYDAQGNQQEAIRRAEAAALLAPNDIGTLFQLGLLYYKANRLSDAGVVLERAVAINVNYSNARYFLGLIYDRTSRSSKAIEEFEIIPATARLRQFSQIFAQVARRLRPSPRRPKTANPHQWTKIKHEFSSDFSRKSHQCSSRGILARLI